MATGSRNCTLDRAITSLAHDSTPRIRSSQNTVGPPPNECTKAAIRSAPHAEQIPQVTLLDHSSREGTNRHTADQDGSGADDVAYLRRQRAIVVPSMVCTMQELGLYFSIERNVRGAPMLEHIGITPFRRLPNAIRVFQSITRLPHASP